MSDSEVPTSCSHALQWQRHRSQHRPRCVHEPRVFPQDLMDEFYNVLIVFIVLPFFNVGKFASERQV